MHFVLSLSVTAKALPNFNLLDTRATNVELYGAGGKAVVLFFTGTGCPIAQKSVSKFVKLEREYAAQGISFWIVNSYADESKRDIQKEIGPLKSREMTYLLDSKQTVVYAYDVNRNFAPTLFSVNRYPVRLTPSAFPQEQAN